MVPLSSIGSAAAHAPTGAAPPCQARFGDALRAHGAPDTPPSSSPSAASWTRAALEHVERARERMDEVLAAAQRGQTFTPPELLALQAQAYRYSQTVEVASKVVEHGVQSVKQAIQAQV